MPKLSRLPSPFLLARSSQSNFFSSFFFLPKEKRRAMEVVYAFCRHADDWVDQYPEGAYSALAEWRRKLENLATSAPLTDPLEAQLFSVIRQYEIPGEYFVELLDGVQMDLRQNRYETFDALYEYCYRVASVVGLISLKIFGAQRVESQFYAVNLGIALQLTNILRDIGEDYSRGRIYIPQEDLQKFGYTERDLHHRTYNHAFINLMKFEVERAKLFYRRAEGYAYSPDWKKLAAAQIMGATYYALLEQIEENDYAVFETQARLSPGKKARIAAQTFLKNRLASWVGIGREK